MIDMTCPEIPMDIFALTEEADLTFHSECEVVWNSIYTELTDPFYTGRSHHNVGTYDQGCRGPLCRKAHREHPRRKINKALSPRPERNFDPVMEYFHTVMKHRIKIAQRTILEELKETS